MKKIITSLLTIIFIIAMITTVNAANEKIILTPSIENLKPGENFTVAVNASSSLNITGLEAGLSFDSSKVELIEKLAGEGFTDMSGTDNSKLEFALNNQSSAKTNSTICTLKFRVLENATARTTATINLSDVQIAVVTEDALQQNVSLSENPQTIINIIEVANVDEGNTNNGIILDGDDDNTGIPSNTDDDPTIFDDDNSSDNTTKTSSKISQTGLESGIIFVIAGLSIIATISYIAYRKYNNI